VIVVSDTSVLVCLAYLGRLDLLATLYVDVVVPTAVANEAARPRAGYGGVPRTDLASLHVVEAPPAAVEAMRTRFPDLHAGELAALAVAIDLPVDAVLIDEADGRAAAATLGLRVVGTIGVLLAAKSRGLVVEVRPLIDVLIDELRFRVAPAFRADVLRLAGEPDEPHRP